jgi:hypothetical protein
MESSVHYGLLLFWMRERGGAMGKRGIVERRHPSGLCAREGERRYGCYYVHACN